MFDNHCNYYLIITGIETHRSNQVNTLNCCSTKQNVALTSRRTIYRSILVLLEAFLFVWKHEAVSSRG